MSDAETRLATALADRYRIERELGQGGMATVYLAHDLRHSRRVALKVLHPDLAAALGAERFLAEIATTASLQHPHILPLHDSGEAGDLLFYVMPFVEGETLRARLEREQLLPVDDAIRLTREILSALDYAHRHGVVHRDIKPENILLHDGQAIVADFGISLAVSAASGPRMTQTGLSLGTPSYMSPEQATGDRVIDGRADIYAVGATLYEMLIGEPPFTGPTSQAIVARLLTEEPRSLTAQRKMIPPNVDAAVRKALQKLPADRFASAADMSAAIARSEFTVEAFTAARTSDAPGSRARRVVLIASVAGAAAAIGAIAAIAGSKVFARPPVAEPLVRFSFSVPYSADLLSGGLAISPDGSRIVFVGMDSGGTGSLFVRSLGSESFSPLPGTLGASRPFFSPDGQQIGFVHEGAIRRMLLDGGAVTTVMPVQGLPFVAWPSDSTILVSGGPRLRRISANGGAIDSLSSSDSADFTNGPIAAAPGGKSAIVARSPRGMPGAQLFYYSIPRRRFTPLGISGTAPMLIEGGYLLYADPAGTLFSVAIDMDTGRMIGKPTPVIGGVRVSNQRAHVAASRSGVIIFTPPAGSGANELVVVDRGGKAVPIPVAASNYRNPRLSPDGRRLVVVISRADEAANVGDVWTYDFTSQRMSRLTFDGFSLSPSWMADGRTITFTHRETGKPIAIYRVPADGSGTATPYFTTTLGNPYEASYTPDGKSIVFRVDTRTTKRDVVLAPVDSPQVTRPLLTSPFDEHMIAVSPDGRWLAYVSDASGRKEVYLRRIDGASGVWPVSRDGGTEPRWGGSARELLFRHGDSIYTVPLELGADAHAGQPRALFSSGNYAAAPWDTFWDVSRDGSRFVFVRQTRRAPDKLTVLLHALPTR
jgi:eukaryotic-like serine/threonine-protein kinase